MTVIKGVDLSIAATAIASSDSTWVQLFGFDGVTKMDLRQKVHHMDLLAAEIKRAGLGADLTVIEGLDSARSYGAVNERAHLWYEVVSFWLRHGIQVVEVQSQRLKIYSTGTGTASKDAVKKAVRHYWPSWDISKGGRSSKDDDNKADAVAAMALGRHLVGQPLCAMPEVHLRKLPDLAPQLAGTVFEQAQREESDGQQ